MFYWWFKNIENLKVTLDDIEGYEGQKVPAYLLWQPFITELEPNVEILDAAFPGVYSKITEAMQTLRDVEKFFEAHKWKTIYCKNIK